MKSKSIRYAIMTLGILLSACSPSKEEMCEAITENRSLPAEEETYSYVKCLNASNDWVEERYKEIKTSEGNK